jgi:DNA-binding MarR family transcriptional regulator
VFQDFIRQLREVDIRPAQFSVLVVISTNPGLSQADVAESLGIERARLVHVLDLLEERQLIQRLRSVEDRRSHSLHLTAEGQRVLKRAQALAADHEARLEKVLGADRRARLLEILREVDLPS